MTTLFKQENTSSTRLIVVLTSRCLLNRCFIQHSPTTSFTTPTSPFLVSNHQQGVESPLASYGSREVNRTFLGLPSLLNRRPPPVKPYRKKLDVVTTLWLRSSMFNGQSTCSLRNRSTRQSLLTKHISCPGTTCFCGVSFDMFSAVTCHVVCFS